MISYNIEHADVHLPDEVADTPVVLVYKCNQEETLGDFGPESGRANVEVGKFRQEARLENCLQGRGPSVA